MKKILIIIVLLVTGMSKAQEFKLAPYTQYLENPFLISPAYAGEGEMNRLRLSGALQWVGLEGAPNTQTLSYDSHLWDKSGVGGVLYRDKNGNTSQSGGQLSFAHHLTIDDFRRQYISFGLSYKFTQFRIDTFDFEDAEGDEAVGGGVASFNSNFDAAFLFKWENYYISINAANIINKDVKAFDESEPIKIRNYYVYTGYVFELEGGAYEIEPSIYFKLFESDMRSATDLNINGKIITDDGYYWVGFSTRFLTDQNFNASAIVPMLGLKKNNFHVSYAFQYNINEASELNHAGTHMLSLGYDLEPKNARNRR